jgi:hypothetical protein
MLWADEVARPVVLGIDADRHREALAVLVHRMERLGFRPGEVTEVLGSVRWRDDATLTLVVDGDERQVRVFVAGRR